MSTETDSVTTGAEKGPGGIQPGVAHVEDYNKASAQGQLATDQYELYLPASFPNQD